jgi:hypothetical protein
VKRKPDSCLGCALYKDGYGFVPDLINEDAEVIVFSMFPTTYESRVGQIRTGMVIDQYHGSYEKYAGPIQKSYSHVIRCRGQKGTPLPRGKALKDGAEFCRQYDVIPEATKLVVLNGLQAGKTVRPDMGVTRIQRWRGFIYPPKEETDG